MGNRSYLLTQEADQCKVLLEANNLLPLLWVAMAGGDHVAQLNSLPTPALGLDEREPGGLSIPLPEALDNLARRRALIERWLGVAGATILDQFADLLQQGRTTCIHLDLSEYIDLHESAAEALATLQKAAAALDTDPAKGSPRRRPPPIKWLMDEFNLSGVDSDAPLFGVAMAGAMEGDSEPWRREPPRPRRTPGEPLHWSNHDTRISANGRVIVGTLCNRERLYTPLIWNRDTGALRLLDVPDHVGEIFAGHLNSDGSVLLGSCHVYPGKRYTPFRWHDGNFTLLDIEAGYVYLLHAACSDARVVVGQRYLENSDYEAQCETDRAFRMVVGEPAVDIGPAGTPSVAQLVTPDGRTVAGYTVHGRGATREQRAFVWHLHGQREDLSPGYFSLDWVALAPDGASGLLRYMGEYGGPYGYLYWRRGQSLQPIPELMGASRLRVSNAVDALAACVPDRPLPLVWRPDGSVRELDLGTTRGKIEPLYVADGATTIVVEESVADGGRSCKDILVWSEDGSVRRHAVDDESGARRLFWRRQNRPPRPANLVVNGDYALEDVQLIWTLDDGLQVFPREPQ